MSNSFDDILKDKIGFGAYQYKAYGALGFIDFIDGIELVLSMFLPAIIQHEWGISDIQVELLGSIFFIGSFLGYFVTGLLLDAIGRKSTLLIGNVLALFTFIFTALVQTYWQILVVRFFYGFILSLTTPVSFIMLSEISPKEIRGRAQLMLQFFYLAGNLYIICVMCIFMDSLVEGNWRAVALSTSIPCFLMLLGNIFLLDESPRFLMVVNRFDDAINVINKIGVQNHKQQYVPLSLDEIENLKKLKTELFKSDNYTIKEKFYGLFHSDRIGVTWRLLTVSILLSFVGGGLMLLIPFILSAEKKGFGHVALTYLAQAPAIIIVYFIIDRPELGRVKLYIIFHFLSTSVYFFIFYYKEPFLVIGIMILKFGMKLKGSIITPIYTESYSTVYRAIAISFLGAIGRLTGAITPFIIFEIYQKDNYLPFLIFGIICIIPGISMLSFPVQATGKELDDKQVLYQQIQQENPDKNDSDLVTEPKLKLQNQNSLENQSKSDAIIDSKEENEQIYNEKVLEEQTDDINKTAIIKKKSQ